MFKISYYHNPITYFPTKNVLKRGESDISLGLIKLKEKGENRNFNTSATSIASQIVFGLSKIYAFHTHQFFSDNFQLGLNKWTKQKALKYRHKICGRKTWYRIIFKLRNQLKAVHNFNNIRTLKDSSYGKYSSLPDTAKFESSVSEQVDSNSRCLGNFDFNQPYNFTATFSRLGIDKKHVKPTVLIINVKYHGILIAKHLWLNYNHNFRKIGEINKNAPISLIGYVYKYYSDGMVKYSLAHVFNIKRLSNDLFKDSITLPKRKDVIIGYIIVHNHKQNSYKDSAFDMDINAYHNWLNKIKA